ncbi:unnamed protein product [Closterium sp. NIES-65]|nr:unnamed protein product [Closterium sp. NIES-65]
MITSMSSLHSEQSSNKRKMDIKKAQIERWIDRANIPLIAGTFEPDFQILAGILRKRCDAVRRPWDVRETDDAFHIRLDMPGLSKEEVSVKLENGDLVIRGEHKVETAEETGGEEEEGLRDARVAKSYQVTLALPDNVLTNQIKAEMKNGVLTVTMAKVAPPEAGPAAVEIPVA